MIPSESTNMITALNERILELEECLGIIGSIFFRKTPPSSDDIKVVIDILKNKNLSNVEIVD